MKKITCEVMKDLMPLYVDRMLSEDSTALLEEHLANCEACRGALKKLKQEANPIEGMENRDQEEKTKDAFKKIRRSIRRQRMIAVCISVFCVLAAVRVGYYCYAEKESYISYEDSGLVMQGDKLYATKTYYGRMSSIISPDQTVQFIQMQETAEVKKVYPSVSCKQLVEDYSDQLDPSQRTYEDEDKLSGIEKVYYLPEEYVNYRFDYDDPEKGAAQTKELEENSILLWEKSADE
jgi:hypothetical protein